MSEQLDLVPDDKELLSATNVLDTMSLTDAMWWFIDNVNPEYKYRHELYRYIRQRYNRALNTKRLAR